MILIENVYAFILYVSYSDLQCNKHNSHRYKVQYQDRQTALGSWNGPVEIILPSPPTRAMSFPLVRTTTLGQSVYPDIALHISNYHINIETIHRNNVLDLLLGIRHNTMKYPYTANIYIQLRHFASQMCR
jgi:hypothetical protein